MPIKTFVGGVISDVEASDLNTYLIQSHHVIKPSDESVTSSVSFQNDDHLFFQVTPNTMYWVIAQLLYTGSTTGDLQIGFSAPSGSTMNWCSDALGSGATGNADIVSRSRQIISSSPVAGAITGSDTIACCKGILRTSTSGGTFRVKWCQGTSNATATTVKAGSMFMARRLV